MLLSNEYRPDPRVEKEAYALADEGFHVEILCWDRAHTRLSKEFREKIEIVRITTLDIRDKVSFLVNVPFFMIKMILRALTTEHDVVHAHDLDTLIQGIFISKIKRTLLVYDAHEHYASMVSEDVPVIISRALNSLEKILVRRIDALIVANDRIGELIDSNLRSKPTVIMNCVEIDQGDGSLGFRSNDGVKYPDDIVIFYGGSLEPSRYLLEVAEVVTKLEGFIFKIAGSGRLADQLRKFSEASKKIQFLGFLKRDELLQHLKKSSIALCLADPSNANNKIGTPNRLFEAMAFGIPVIASKGTFAGEIVEENRCGLVIEWSEENFLEAIEALGDIQLRQELGRNGRLAVEREYSWNIMKKRLIDLYNSLL